jgi:hypothetical protein
MNSQYPYAMLNDMPVGNPILNSEKDFNNFFWICLWKSNPTR